MGIEFKELPNGIQGDIFQISGNHDVRAVSKSWKQTWETEVFEALKREALASSSNNNFTVTVPEKKTTLLFNELFKKAIGYDTTNQFVSEVRSDKPISTQLRNIHKSIHKGKVFNYTQLIVALYSWKQAQVPDKLYQDAKSFRQEYLSKEASSKISSKKLLHEIKSWLQLEKDTLSKITFLDLSKIGKMSTVPKEIKLFSSLQNLDLSNKRLRKLPAEIATLASLEFLDLFNNLLVTLPPELSKLDSLRISFVLNPIDYFPSQIAAILPRKDGMSCAFDLPEDIEWIHFLLKEKSSYTNPLECLLENPHAFASLIRKTSGPDRIDTKIIECLLSKMEQLRKLQIAFENATEEEQPEILHAILNFDTENLLYEQQIIEVVIKIFSNLVEDHPLKQFINLAVAKEFGFDLEKESEAGLEKFLFRPLNTKVKRAVLSL